MIAMGGKMTWKDTTGYASYPRTYISDAEDDDLPSPSTTIESFNTAGTYQYVPYSSTTSADFSSQTFMSYGTAGTWNNIGYDYAPLTYAHSPSPDSMSHKNLKSTPNGLGWAEHSEIINLYTFKPGKGKTEPYFELLPKWTETAQTPHRVYLDPPSNPERGVYTCQFPSSCDRHFSRPADLQRHYEKVHTPNEERNRTPCDYPKCGRSKDAFTRRDHLRDHLRDYHHEDIGRAKAYQKLSKSESKELQDSWLKNRSISSTWWRCPKCLVRNRVDRGWCCVECKTPCETERIEARAKLAGTTLDVNQAQPHKNNVADDNCCFGMTWSHGDFEPLAYTNSENYSSSF